MIPDAKPDNSRRYFGAVFPPHPVTGEALTELEALCAAFVRTRDWAAMGATWPREEYFWRIVELGWGKHSTKHFVRHPWAEQMAYEACREKYLGVSACASGGKSDFFAMWAIVNWFVWPAATKVLVTSTSLKESRKRIWGSIREYYQAASFMGINKKVLTLPGKLVDSMAQIRTINDDGNPMSDKSGIELVAGDQSKEAEAVQKLIGMKQRRVLMIADELPDLSESLMNAAYGNLAMNPDFQLVGLGNFKSWLDPFGRFTTPADGYNSIDIETTRWKTERGVCIRFDGMKSPNVLLGEDQWPIYGVKQLKEHMEMGENTAQFWRMCRSFPAPIGLNDQIYSESDLLAGNCFSRALWAGEKTRVASLDPGFTNDGDRSVAWFGWHGLGTNGKPQLEYDRMVHLKEDVRQKGVPHSFQIARLFRDLCVADGVRPQHAAYDATGAGGPFGEILHQEWHPGVLAVDFGGSPSDLPVSDSDLRASSEAYRNRVTELWVQGLGFVRGGQIRGMTPALARELTSRRYDERQRGAKVAKVESKKDMRARTGFSPDIADSALILLELCRQRFGFSAHPFGGAMRAARAEQNEAVEAADSVWSEDSIAMGDDQQEEESFEEMNYA